MRFTPDALRKMHGSTYLALMFLIVILAIGMTAAAKQWKTVVQREKEADLLWRGIEIQTAIQVYSNTMKQGRVIPGEIYPQTLEDLTKPPKPSLRKAYKDPITGGDWQYIRDQAGREKRLGHSIVQVARQAAPFGGHGHTLGLGVQPSVLDRQRGLIAEGDGQLSLFSGEHTRITVV